MAPSRSLITRRRVTPLALAALAAPVWGRALARDDTPQPLALKSGFPQMPTGGTGVTPCGSANPPSRIESFGWIAPQSEPGEAIEITGRVLRADRKTPAAGIVLFAYHTDAGGDYNHPNSPFKPRLYGWVKTDAQGRYGFRTIMPGPYPAHDTPRHIHASLFGPGLAEYWIDDYWFAGDPLITAAQRATLTGRGGGGETVPLERAGGGILRGRRDIVLQQVRVSGNCRILRA
jgi:protocatechuate 3,4-dioxygenase, beta subunit